MIRFQQSQALTSQFESFWSIVQCVQLIVKWVELATLNLGQNGVVLFHDL